MNHAWRGWYQLVPADELASRCYNRRRVSVLARLAVDQLAIDPSSASAEAVIARSRNLPPPTRPAAFRQLAERHLRFGWASLLVFLTLGIVLEAMHGLKIGWYLDVGNDTRRLLLTLAHAHGTLLGLLHIAFAVTVLAAAIEPPSWRRLASPCLMASSVLLPGGFVLGALATRGGDAGLGIVLVPVGAAALLVATAVVTKRVALPAIADD